MLSLQRPHLTSLIALVAVSIPTTLALWGLDFGYHWDESKLLTSVTRAIEQEWFLPGWYHYPSLCFWIGVLTEPVSRLFGLGMNATESLRFTLRALMVLISMGTCLWTFGLVRQWRKSSCEAILAALLLSLSFEINYHSRWIAPDPLLMHFGIACMYMVTRAWNAPGKPKWLYLATLMASLACSSKYPGGLFLCPIYLLILIGPTHCQTRSDKFFLCLKVSALFGLIFVIVNPGLLFETSTFLRDVQSEIAHYRNGHGTYGVAPGPDHFTSIIVYLSTVALSPYPVIAGVLSFGTIYGVYRLFSSEQKQTVCLLILPTLYGLYFCSQRVMIVRNLMVLLPFISICTAVGICELLAYLNRTQTKFIAIVILATFMSANLLFLAKAAQSITQTHDENRALAAFISQHPSAIVFGTPSASAKLKPARTTPASDDWVIFRSDVEPTPNWITNEPNVYYTISGPLEVNWSYYPSWRGPMRLLAVRYESALRMGLFDRR